MKQQITKKNTEKHTLQIIFSKKHHKLNKNAKDLCQGFAMLLKYFHFTTNRNALQNTKIYSIISEKTLKNVDFLKNT